MRSTLFIFSKSEKDINKMLDIYNTCRVSGGPPDQLTEQPGQPIYEAGHPTHDAGQPTQDAGLPTYARVVMTSPRGQEEEDTLTKIRNLGTFGFQNLG